MFGFNYPMRVLKKKIESEDYTPFAVDCHSGQAIALQDSRFELFAYRAFQLVLALAAVAIIYYIVLSPILETSRARANVDVSLSALSGEDAGIIQALRENEELVSETIENGLVTLVLNTNRSQLQKNLDLAFSLTSVREVYTDGKTIAITFVSSAP